MRISFSLPILVVATCIPAAFLAAPAAAQQYPAPHPVLIAMQTRLSGSYLGVGLWDIDADRAKAIHLGEARGVEVMRVEDGGPAEDAGLRVGDVLLSYNGETILGAQQVGRLVAETPVNRKIKIEYWRTGKQQTAFITTGSIHFSGSGAFANQMGGPDQDVPEVHTFTLIDIPNSLVIWKNGALGIVCESLDVQLAQFFGVKQGVLIRSVDEKSPASKSGARAGDVITAIGDKAVSNPHDVNSYLRMERRRALKSVALEVTREHKPVMLKVSFQDGPE